MCNFQVMLLNIGELFFIILDLLIGIKSKLTFVLSVKYSKSLETCLKIKERQSIYMVQFKKYLSLINNIFLTYGQYF